MWGGGRLASGREGEGGTLQQQINGQDQLVASVGGAGEGGLTEMEKVMV